MGNGRKAGLDDGLDIIHQGRDFSSKRKILWRYWSGEKLEPEKQTGYSSVSIQEKVKQQINRFKVRVNSKK